MAGYSIELAGRNRYSGRIQLRFKQVAVQLLPFCVMLLCNSIWGLHVRICLCLKLSVILGFLPFSEEIMCLVISLALTYFYEISFSTSNCFFNHNIDSAVWFDYTFHPTNSQAVLQRRLLWFFPFFLWGSCAVASSSVCGLWGPQWDSPSEKIKMTIIFFIWRWLKSSWIWRAKTKTML